MDPSSSRGAETNPAKKFALPSADSIDAMMKEFSVPDGTPAIFKQWQKDKAKSLKSSSSSVLALDDSRSNSGNSGGGVSTSASAVSIFSEESNHAFLRHEVSQDSKFASQVDDDFWPEEEEPPAPEFKAPKETHNNTNWVKKRFRYMVRGDNKKRPKSQIMEEADEFDLTEYPRRVLIAKHIHRPRWGNKPLPPNLSPFTYEFYVYNSIKHLLNDLKNMPERDRTLFTVAEENGAVMVYLDLEIPMNRVDAAVHGTSSLALFGYCIALVKTVLSMILEMNLSCWSDSYLIYESSDATKWSAHAHIPLPFRAIGSLRESMARVKDTFAKLFEAGIPAFRPLFYLDQNKTGAFEWKTVVDMKVFTKKRNFRLPLNTKVAKNAYLKSVNNKLPNWNRFPSAPCSVDLNNFENSITAGMILARNSRAFWNPMTVKYAPLLQNKSSMDAKPSDFRCLPPTGSVNSMSSELRKLYALGNTWPDQETKPVRDRVSKALESFFKHMYDEDWEEMIRPVLGSEDSTKAQLRSVVKNLYTAFEKSPRFMAIFLMLLLQVYRPGAGLDQKLVETAFAIDTVRSVAQMIYMELFRNNNPIKAFSTLLAFYGHVDLALSKTCSEEQGKMRQEFIKSLSNDFIENYLKVFVMKNAYTRLHLMDTFVLNNICRYLLLCSGYYVHCMSVPMGYGHVSLHVLPHTPLGYKPTELSKMYAFVFKTAFTMEGKEDAPPVFRIACRSSYGFKGLPQEPMPFIVHGMHYSEDLLETIKRIRATQLGSETDTADGPRAMFAIVNMHNREPASK